MLFQGLSTALVVKAARSYVREWNNSLTESVGFQVFWAYLTVSLLQLRLERKAGDAALLSTDPKSVAARQDVKSRKSLYLLIIPEYHLPLPSRRNTRRTFQTNVHLSDCCEWISTTVLVGNVSKFSGSTNSGESTPAQRMAKAAKMIGYVSRTPRENRCAHKNG